MDAEGIATAEACRDGAHDGTLAFPAIVARLMDAGFEGYAVDYRRNTTTYYMPDGDSVALASHAADPAVGAAFDAAGIAACIRWAQSNAPDYSYVAFCARVKALGCAGYLVSFPGRRVLYYGRTAETHVEHFPQ